MPLRVHGHYSRAETEAAYCFAEACGYGVLSTESPWIHREGVLWHQPSATDLLFISLRKSEALFSPSTRHRELALGPALLPLGEPDHHHRLLPHRPAHPPPRLPRLAGDPGGVAARLLLGIAAALAV